MSQRLKGAFYLCYDAVTMMQTTPTITIPASTADKLAALGRAMLDLAKEMKEHAGKKEASHADLHDIPVDQRWFWSPQWQAMEQEADEAITQEKYEDFGNAEDAIAYLHRQV